MHVATCWLYSKNKNDTQVNTAMAAPSLDDRVSWASLFWLFDRSYFGYCCKNANFDISYLNTKHRGVVVDPFCATCISLRNSWYTYAMHARAIWRRRQYSCGRARARAQSIAKRSIATRSIVARWYGGQLAAFNHSHNFAEVFWIMQQLFQLMRILLLSLKTISRARCKQYLQHFCCF